ncbi:VanZ family protein [Streptomyces sp. NBC_00237]|uniref:VanZ family protein n=1 Tax=Streptomyces sp. NBC_00237 TaxID=2975687 RepID=UPI00225036FB|nr:VanZ family protein [Streptomyces sp. NBC_00237]MCX5200461.1 VanZ family protein [Streptomyces sp. NBC_00237]
MTAERTPAADAAPRPLWTWVVLRTALILLAFLVLIAFSVVLAKLTLVPSPASEGLVHSNLRPGDSLRQYARDYTFLAACKQVGGNVLLGVPFGVLLPILGPRRWRFLRMLFATVAVIVLVELAQGAIVTGRAFDVDDVIMNTTGALIGYLVLGRRLGRVVHRKRFREEPPVTDGPADEDAAGGPAAGRPEPAGPGTGKASRWSRGRRLGRSGGAAARTP